MVKESASEALADAKIKYTDVKQAVVGYVYGSQLSMTKTIIKLTKNI